MILLAIQTALNITGAKVMGRVAQFGVYIEIIGTLGIAIILAIHGFNHGLGFLFSTQDAQHAVAQRARPELPAATGSRGHPDRGARARSTSSTASSPPGTSPRRPRTRASRCAEVHRWALVREAVARRSSMRAALLFAMPEGRDPWARPSRRGRPVHPLRRCRAGCRTGLLLADHLRVSLRAARPCRERAAGWPSPSPVTARARSRRDLPRSTSASGRPSTRCWRAPLSRCCSCC